MRTPVATALALTIGLTGCAANSTEGPVTEQLRAEVLETLPHDVGAFTQGLELDGGTLYEGTGLVGKSALRAGPLGQPPVTEIPLPSPLFGEGITVTGDSVWQLTWQNQTAIEYDKATLTERRRVSYEGEGWGICQQDSGRLVMSDGSAELTFRDPATFAETGSVGVQRDKLNELECVGDSVYANVWQTDEILRIGPDGAITGHIDASGLLSAPEAGGADVLNGIAAVPGTDEFLLTGKLWPKMFRVKFVPTAP
ncbi:glutaminyl-peptide cyclotransferase [Amycolatopsis magusensis]|uniref:glutaminyl-peptide cyclotransferase n=1 Tax=Amycolatopsis magusensis TaxID=882444 RepID=UPI003C30A9E9